MIGESNNIIDNHNVASTIKARDKKKLTKHLTAAFRPRSQTYKLNLRSSYAAGESSDSSTTDVEEPSSPLDADPSSTHQLVVDGNYITGSGTPQPGFYPNFPYNTLYQRVDYSMDSTTLLNQLERGEPNLHYQQFTQSTNAQRDSQDQASLKRKRIETIKEQLEVKRRNMAVDHYKTIQNKYDQMKPRVDYNTISDAALEHRLNKARANSSKNSEASFDRLRRQRYIIKKYKDDMKILRQKKRNPERVKFYKDELLMNSVCLLASIKLNSEGSSHVAGTENEESAELYIYNNNNSDHQTLDRTDDIDETPLNSQPTQESLVPESSGRVGKSETQPIARPKKVKKNKVKKNYKHVPKKVHFNHTVSVCFIPTKPLYDVVDDADGVNKEASFGNRLYVRRSSNNTLGLYTEDPMVITESPVITNEQLVDQWFEQVRTFKRKSKIDGNNRPAVIYKGR